MNGARAVRIVLLLCILGLAPCESLRAEGNDLQCVVSAVTCGEVSTSTTELDTCTVLEIVKVGDVDSKAYAQVQLFWGFKVSGDALILGAKAKTGMLLTCKVPFSRASQKPDYEILKKELPALLKDNDEIRKAYPNVQRVKVDGETIKFDESPTQAVRDGIKAEPKFKSRLGRHDD
jgi:hypothetical protein